MDNAELCPPGMHAVASAGGGMACSVCPLGFCGTLPRAQLLPATALDLPLQAAVAGSPFSAASMHSGINPSVFEWRGRRVVVARATNLAACVPQQGPPRPASSRALESTKGGGHGEAARKLITQQGQQEAQEQGSDGPTKSSGGVSSRLKACDLGAAGRPVAEARAQRCREIPVDIASLATQVPGTMPTDGLEGVEDPRTFIHAGRPHVLVTFHLMQREKRTYARRRQWHEPAAPLVNRMAALRLSATLDRVEHAAVLVCPELANPRQKNWMPLQPSGEATNQLFLVTDLQPLTVVQADLVTGACRLVHGGGNSSGKSSADANSAPHSPASAAHGGLGGGDDAAAEGGAPSLAAVLGGARLHGGSPFVPVGSGRHLSIVHHKRGLPFGSIYTHHWVLLEAAAGRFRLAWVSEGFRLPDLPGVRPSRDIQFASSLTLEGDELVIGYGAGDCHSVLVRVPDFRTQLKRWLDTGLGTASNTSAPTLAQHLPLDDAASASHSTHSVHSGTMNGATSSGSSVSLVKWEASLFGREARWAQAAKAIGTRWQQSVLPTSHAQLVLRHLDQEGSASERRDLGSLALASSNELNNLVADVAISHARLGKLVPAVSRAWLPWVSNLGPSASNASLALLRRHAARVLVPSDFHRASLVHLLGMPAQQVAVLPQPVPAEDWCPGWFDELSGRQALQALGGPPASAPHLIFLHQAPPAWHYGADLLLQAYASAFSAADNTTLVIHLLPEGPEDEAASEPSASGIGGSGGPGGPSAGSEPSTQPLCLKEVLEKRVAALSKNATAPRVLLITSVPVLGRWADKLLHAADVAVLPYLSGTAGRELVRAASCGRPVVTTAGGPGADWLGRAAWLVPSRLESCRLGQATQAHHASGEDRSSGKDATAHALTPLGCLQVSPGDLAHALRSASSSAGARQKRGMAAKAAAARLAEETGWETLSHTLWRHVQDHLPPAALAS